MTERTKITLDESEIPRQWYNMIPDLPAPPPPPLHPGTMQPAGPPQNVNPKELAPARGFSHATVSGDTVWVGGQVGSAATGKIVEPGDIVAQYARAIRNVAVALRAAGCEPEDTVKLTYYVTDIEAYRDNRAGLGAAYREFFRSDYPASTLIEVQSLVDPDAMVEIDAVAVRRVGRLAPLPRAEATAAPRCARGRRRRAARLPKRARDPGLGSGSD